MSEEQIDFSSYDFVQRDKINEYLKKMIAFGGSDLHVKAKSVIRARKDGKIHQFSGGIISAEDCITLAKEILKSDYIKFTELKEYDTVHKFNEKYSFRVNFFFQKDGVSAVFRIIPTDIPSLDELKMPEVIKSFTQKERGLILVTGITGSGKSTTLASMTAETHRTGEGVNSLIFFNASLPSIPGIRISSNIMLGSKDFTFSTPSRPS